MGVTPDLACALDHARRQAFELVAPLTQAQLEATPDPIMSPLDLRGGSWATGEGLRSPTLRNWDLPRVGRSSQASASRRMHHERNRHCGASPLRARFYVSVGRPTRHGHWSCSLSSQRCASVRPSSISSSMNSLARNR